MVTSKRKGYNFEYRVKRYLEGLGWFVVRCAGSKPFDLIGFSPNGIIYLIECKYAKYISKNQLFYQDAIYMRLREKFNVRYVVVNPKNFREVLK